MDRERRQRPTAHSQGWFSHARFLGSNERPFRRRSRRPQRSGQIAARPGGAAAQDRHRPLANKVPPPLYIAMRFLVHRKRALLLSLAGVVFGVAIFIGTQAQTQGFAKYFVDSSLGSNGAVIVRSRFRPRSPMLVPPKNSKIQAAHRSYFEGIDDASAIMRVSRQFSDVVSCSPVLRGTLSARSGFENATVDLFGIDPALHLQTTDLVHQLVDGSFDDFRNKPNTVIVGSRLAETLNLEVGDTVQLLSPGGQYRRFGVAAIAKSGVGSVDS